MKYRYTVRNKKHNRITKKRIRGGNIVYTLSEIEHYWNESYNRKFPRDKRQPYNGEFVVHKAFKVNAPALSNISGYVIQKVEKTTDAYTIEDGIKNKIEDIESFTSDNVKYMNDTYYELFFIIKGESTDGDNFQNGAILIYTLDPYNGSVGPDDDIDTAGRIQIKGTSWFIKADTEEVKNKYRQYKNSLKSKMKMNLENEYNTIHILDIDWILDSKTPANGLPYSKMLSRKADILSRDSNILQHDVEVIWDTTKASKKGYAKSETSSIITKIA